MLTLNTCHIFRDLIVQIGQQEKQLEVVRQILCEQPEFEPYAAFRRIDRGRKGYIMAVDIFEFLLSNEFHITEEDCRYFIDHYDRDFDGRLAYSEFLPAVLPFDNPDLRTIVTQRKVFDIAYSEFLPYEVEYALGRVIAQEINSYIEIEDLKNELTHHYDFTLFNAFATVDVYETGFIDFNNLKNFLKTYSRSPNEGQVVEILRRMDRDDDGRISYDEFAQAIQSTTPGRGRTTQSKKTRQAVQDHGRSRGFAASLHGFHQRTKSQEEVHSKTIRSPIKTTTSPIKRVMSPSQQSTLKESHLRNSQTSPQNKKFTSTGENFRRTGGATHFSKETSVKEKGTIKVGKTQKTECWKSPKKIKNSKTLVGQGNSLSSLVLIFKEIIALEREVEFAKQDLALRADFNLFDTFRLLDRKGKGIITVREFEATFKELEMFPAKEDLYLLIKRLDKDGDGKLRFIEFTAGFAPVQKEYYDMVKTRPAVNGDLNLDVDELLDPQTKKMFKRLLTLYLENEAVIEALRQRLAKDQSFNIREAFENLDLDGDEYLTLYEVREVMDINDMFVTGKDAEYLINRFDKEDKQRISFAEFVQEISPKSSKKY